MQLQISSAKWRTFGPEKEELKSKHAPDVVTCKTKTCISQIGNSSMPQSNHTTNTIVIYYYCIKWVTNEQMAINGRRWHKQTAYKRKKVPLKIQKPAIGA